MWSRRHIYIYWSKSPCLLINSSCKTKKKKKQNQHKLYLIWGKEEAGSEINILITFCNLCTRTYTTWTSHVSNISQILLAARIKDFSLTISLNLLISLYGLFHVSVLKIFRSWMQNGQRQMKKRLKPIRKRLSRYNLWKYPFRILFYLFLLRLGPLSIHVHWGFFTRLIGFIFPPTVSLRSRIWISTLLCRGGYNRSGSRSLWILTEQSFDGTIEFVKKNRSKKEEATPAVGRSIGRIFKLRGWR